MTTRTGTGPTRLAIALAAALVILLLPSSSSAQRARRADGESLRGPCDTSQNYCGDASRDAAAEGRRQLEELTRRLVDQIMGQPTYSELIERQLSLTGESQGRHGEDEEEDDEDDGTPDAEEEEHEAADDMASTDGASASSRLPSSFADNSSSSGPSSSQPTIASDGNSASWVEAGYGSWRFVVQNLTNHPLFVLWGRVYDCVEVGLGCGSTSAGFYIYPGQISTLAYVTREVCTNAFDSTGREIDLCSGRPPTTFKTMYTAVVRPVGTRPI